MTRNLKLTLLATAAAAVFSAGSASAYNVFFGEDLGLGEGTPLPVASRVNSTAAQNSFLANLIGVGTETFEGFATGTGAPLALTFPGAGTATLGGTGAIATVTPGTHERCRALRDLRLQLLGSEQRQLHDQRSATRSPPSASGASTSATSTARSR